MSYCITPEFETIVGASRLERLNSHAGTVYGLDSELNISYLNPAWYQFSEENGGDIFVRDSWSIGRCIFDCIPEVLDSFYRELFESTLKEEGSPLISKQSEYECSTPDFYRRFSMHLYSMGKNGIVVVHSLLAEEPHSSPPIRVILSLDEDQYVDGNGIVHQCANCRRIKT